jgi:hypothetical protein
MIFRTCQTLENVLRRNKRILDEADFARLYRTTGLVQNNEKITRKTLPVRDRKASDT